MKSLTYLSQTNKRVGLGVIKLVETKDGSYTLYSKKFQEHYHSISDGALSESLNKHIIPTVNSISKPELKILDISFGLGYNSFATIYYIEQILKSDIEVKIYSPEIDLELIKSLKDFNYPLEFREYRELIQALSNDLEAKYRNFGITIFNEDARAYIERIDLEFDIVYQDAFSYSKTPRFWTLEYFQTLKQKMARESVLSTYSIATPVRVGLYRSGLKIYQNTLSSKSSTIASTFKLSNFKEIDMELKIKNSPKSEPFYDF